LIVPEQVQSTCVSFSTTHSYQTVYGPTGPLEMRLAMRKVDTIGA
jgi:hypothetical protein